MKPLGRIVRLQIQRSCLKRGEGAQRVYDPAPIVAVNQLTLTLTGACAQASDGSYTLDVHNSAHPTTRNNGGVNPISFLFTRHYEAMQERFGPHLAIGCAGESILIESDELITLAQVQGGISIAAKSGPVALVNVIVAAPCKPFSGFALGAAAPGTSEVKPALQFLDAGMRGFYCQLGSATPTVIALGDEVFAT